MFRNRPVSLALVGLFVWVTGCTSYKVIGLGEVDDYGKVRVTLADSSTVGMFSPHIEDASVVGNSIVDRQRSIAISLDDVAHIEAQGTDAGQTALWIAASIGIIAVVVGVGMIITYR